MNPFHRFPPLWRLYKTAVVAVWLIVPFVLISDIQAKIIPLKEAVSICNGDCSKVENATVSAVLDDTFTISEEEDTLEEEDIPPAVLNYTSYTEDDPDENKASEKIGTKIKKGGKKSEEDVVDNTCLDGCWVLERPGPDRSCKCMNSTATSTACFGTEIQSAEECTICDRGALRNKLETHL